MNKSRLNFKKAALALSLLFIVFGCSKKLDRYEDPVWLGGTNIETLEKEGNYTIYLQLMEKAGYKETVIKQLSTLFVPNDEAFEKYFEKKGITSINDLTEDQALELFTLHFLPTTRNANHLVFDKQWSLLESPTGEYRSLFFRKPTGSISEPYKEIPKYDLTHKGKELLIYTGVKFVPLFSKNFFQDYNGNGDVDYPFMYPDSKWGGLMQWHSAAILPPAGKENTTEIEDLAFPTASGFIYYLDQVVDAMPSIEQYLIAHQDKYSLFYDLMQRFATYTEAGSDILGRKLYYKGYSDISNLASEIGPDGNDPRSPDQLVSPSNALYMFTVFLPDNDVLQSYLNNTVLKSFSSLNDVPDITIRYILQTQITDRLELKSKFTKQFHNVYGDVSVIDIANVKPGFMSSNGVVYQSSLIMEPNVFFCVPGSLFVDSSYTVFLTMISPMITSLSGEKEVTLFAPSNDQLLAANIKLIINESDEPEIRQKADDGNWLPMNADELTIFAQDHIYIGKLSDLSGEGYVEMSSYNYMHYSNKTLDGGLNKNIGIPATIVDEKERKNGMLYYLDRPLQTKFRFGQYIMADPDLSDFADLMVQTQMLDLAYIEKDTKNSYPFIKIIDETANAFHWTAFIPDNAAMAKAKADGLIPTDKAELKSFVYYHFVQENTIFDNGAVSGSFKTLLDGKSLTITNKIDSLKITDASGQEVTLEHSDANNLVRRGVIHKITSVLKNN